MIQFWLTTFQNLSGLFSFLLMSTGLLLITLPFTRWSFTEKKNFHPNSDENLVGSFSICYKFFIFVANGQNWIVRIPENLPTKTIAENVFYYLIEFTEKSNWIFESLRAQVQRETIHYTQFSAQLIPPPTSLLFSVPSGYPSDSRGFNIYIWPNVKAAKQSVGMGYQMSTRWPSFLSLCTRATDPTVGLSGWVPGRTGYTLAKMAMKPFVKRVFTVFATNASFLRIISNFRI